MWRYPDEDGERRNWHNWYDVWNLVPRGNTAGFGGRSPIAIYYDATELAYDGYDLRYTHGQCVHVLQSVYS